MWGHVLREGESHRATLQNEGRVTHSVRLRSGYKRQSLHEPLCRDLMLPLSKIETHPPPSKIETHPHQIESGPAPTEKRHGFYLSTTHCRLLD